MLEFAQVKLIPDVVPCHDRFLYCFNLPLVTKAIHLHVRTLQDFDCEIRPELLNIRIQCHLS